ncbi:hypothetical protein [Burkholderia pyrrocinia]|uniref:hypothetical protein n=1 Tax=Burkholderia pyrrocinia TaxID=60550 RepID=UPI001BD1B302|nr:hypothetical protein [Burkholderia pyrrocinia]QVN17502.1 hypothetical protein JYG32_14725 [Burkholderia pyrrocinia]
MYKGDKPDARRPETEHPQHDDRQLAGNCRARQEAGRERFTGVRDAGADARVMLRARQR